MFVHSGTEPPIDWSAIQRHYDDGHTAIDCRRLFGVSIRAWYSAAEHGDLTLRPEHAAKRRGHTRALVAELLNAGLRPAEIARRLGVSASTVCFHMRKLDIPAIEALGRRFDWEAIRAYYEAGHSAKECRARFGFGRNAWADAVARGAIETRPRLEPLEDVLAAGRRRSRHHVKLRLLMAGLKAESCEICGIDRWLDKPLPLELHHANGDGLDNRIENLMLLCPNCHSQTATWGGRKNAGRASLDAAQTGSTNSAGCFVNPAVTAAS